MNQPNRRNTARSAGDDELVAPVERRFEGLLTVETTPAASPKRANR